MRKAAPPRPLVIVQRRLQAGLPLPLDPCVERERALSLQRGRQRRARRSGVAGGTAVPVGGDVAPTHGLCRQVLPSTRAIPSALYLSLCMYVGAYQPGCRPHTRKLRRVGYDQLQSHMVAITHSSEAEGSNGYDVVDDALVLVMTVLSGDA